MEHLTERQKTIVVLALNHLRKDNLESKLNKHDLFQLALMGNPSSSEFNDMIEELRTIFASSDEIVIER